jgi:isoleucyl-tRNA synthetase
VLSGTVGVVVVDCVPDTELEAEGTARDVVRNIQTARKGAGLHISDRIQLSLTLPEEVAEILGGHLAWIATQTLATEIEILIGSPASAVYELSDGTPIGIDLKKI